MSKKGFIIFLVISMIIVLILCFCCFLTFAASAATLPSVENDSIIEETIQQGSIDQQIAIIDIQGMIISTEDSTGYTTDMVESIIAKLEKARQDDNVKAIILRINTPGGTVYDSDLIAQKIKSVETEKPVIALMMTSATSGGYYVSAPSTKIVASETSLTGSIGVVTQIMDLEGLYNKLGIEITTVTNTQGNMKTLQNIDDLESEDRAVLEAVLDDYYESFVQVVADGREMTKEEVMKLADGRIYSGKKAKELKLVDELGNFDTAVQIASDEAGLDDPELIEYQTYVDPFANFRFFMMDNLNPLSKYSNILESDPGLYLYYLPESAV